MPETVSALDRELAARVSLWKLVDPNDHVPLLRSGVKRVTCVSCDAQASLFVTPRGFRCDVCGAAGGAIEFVMLAHRMRERDAIAHLSHLAGLATSRAEWTERVAEASLAADVAALWYEEQFAASPEARAYWDSRGFTTTDAERARIGFAPASGGQFIRAMHDQRLGKRALLDAGLCTLREGGTLAASLRNRLVFPILDDQDAHVLGFSGRAVPGLALHPDAPKYRHVPDNVVFQRRVRLYNIGDARSTIAADRHAVLVEGFTACLRLRSLGIANVVASCGTALTVGQVNALGALCPLPDGSRIRKARGTVTVFFDDGAFRGARAASALLLAAGFDVRIAIVPAGADDPDTLARTAGADAVHAALAAATAPWEAVIAQAARPRPYAIRDREQLLRPVLQLASGATAESVRRRAVAWIATHFDVTDADVTGALDIMATPPKKRPIRSAAAARA